jgi:hypothetical protein
MGPLEDGRLTGGEFSELRAPRPPVPWDRPDRAPKDAVTDRVWIGADPNGLGFEVAVAAWSGAGPPTQEALRTLHGARLRSRAIPLCVAVHDTQGRAWIFGPAASAPALGPIRAGQAARILQAALDELTGSAARSRVLQARDAFETADIPGFDPQGLFAIRELTYGVPRRPDWASACERSRALLANSPRGNDLIRGLGFDSRSVPGNALLLTVGAEPPRAVAILLRDDESFDSESSRFAKSPIYHGLEIARQNNVGWLVVARGPQLRLYPTSPDVGVGRRGATQTYFGLDLALLDDEHAGYLDLAFGARALEPGGSVDQLLEASRDYAVSLGERLRERIYQKVVDPLSTAIARSLAGDAPLDEQRLALAYRLTLRILFRLLFQAYAEDTRLLPLHRNERYTKASLKELARDLAEHSDRPHDQRSTSLWDGLRQVWRVIDTGDEAWGVPAYNGGLFGSDLDLHPDGAAIARLELRNDALGPALAGLLVDVASDEIRGPVDFRALDVRDFGTIYEGLLESGLSLAAEDLTDQEGTWRPAKAGERIVAPGGTPYFHTKSGDRKATGSYFTRPFAVEHLLQRALDPAVDAHLEKVAALVGQGDQVGAARLFFDFRVVDLAMGSGHFLVAAIGHIEARFGAFLEGQPIPGVERELIDLRDAALAALVGVGVDAAIDRSALLSRQIARRCIYGLDVNDIAVELARLAIWVRTFVPGLPMSSLDHQLICANSLTGIGTIDEALGALDPQSRGHEMSFTGIAIESALDEAKRVLEDAAALKESTSEEARAAQSAARQALAIAEPARLLFDAAVAVRLGLMPPPADFDALGIGKTAANAHVQEGLRDLVSAHFPLRFPEVFQRDPPGFDVSVGNPPWEKVKVEADKWWGARLPGLFVLPVGARDVAIDDAKVSRPDLAAQYAGEIARTDRLRDALSRGPYPGLGKGDIDLYHAFAWRNWQVVRDGGRVGLVMPRSLVSEAGSVLWRERVFDDGEFSDVTLLLNTARWAFDMEARYSIALLSLGKLGGRGATVGLAGPFASQAEFDKGVREEVTAFPAADFRTWGSGAAFPILSNKEDGGVYLQMKHHPRLDADLGDWRARAYAEFHATADKPLFNLDSVPPGWWPLYKGESFDLWEPDRGVYYGGVDPDVIVPILTDKRRRAAKLARSPFSEFPPAIIEEDASLPILSPRIAMRLVTRSTDTRTMRVALVPPRVALTHGAPYLLFPRGNETDVAYVLGILCSRPLDWMARRTVEVNLTYPVLGGLSVPRVPRDHPWRRRVVEVTGRLAAVDDRYSSWARAVGVEVGSATSTAAASDLTAELDALAALLYGLDIDALHHVFATFHRGWDFSGRLAQVRGHYERWAGSTS